MLLCTDVDEFAVKYDQSEYKLFTDSSKRSLKGILLHIKTPQSQKCLGLKNVNLKINIETRVKNCSRI